MSHPDPWAKLPTIEYSGVADLDPATGTIRLHCETAKGKEIIVTMSRDSFGCLAEEMDAIDNDVDEYVDLEDELAEKDDDEFTADEE